MIQLEIWQSRSFGVALVKHPASVRATLRAGRLGLSVIVKPGKVDVEDAFWGVATVLSVVITAIGIYVATH